MCCSNLFHSTYLDKRKDLTHVSRQIEKLLAEKSYDGSVDKFDFILAKQKFDGSVYAKVVHDLID